jgi:hypothetical protein
MAYVVLGTKDTIERHSTKNPQDLEAVDQATTLEIAGLSAG